MLYYIKLIMNETNTNSNSNETENDYTFSSIYYKHCSYLENKYKNTNLETFGQIYSHTIMK